MWVDHLFFRVLNLNRAQKYGNESNEEKITKKENKTFFIRKFTFHQLLTLQQLVINNKARKMIYWLLRWPNRFRYLIFQLTGESRETSTRLSNRIGVWTHVHVIIIIIKLIAVEMVEEKKEKKPFFNHLYQSTHISQPGELFISNHLKCCSNKTLSPIPTNWRAGERRLMMMARPGDIRRDSSEVSSIK